MHTVRFVDPAGAIRTGEWNEDTVSFAGREYEQSRVDILPPTDPSKIICIGLNYADHAAETDSEVPDRPLLFMKGPNAVAGHGDTVTVPGGKDRIDYEAELGVVIGKQCRDVNAADALDVVAGYTCVNDISNRDDQRIEQNWIRGKAFDGAAPMGPVLADPEHLADDAGIRLYQNGTIKQDSSIDQLIFDIPDLIEEITGYLTLEPGDVISTGTPAGIGPVEDGDTIEVEIDGIGTLRTDIAFP